MRRLGTRGPAGRHPCAAARPPGNGADAAYRLGGGSYPGRETPEGGPRRVGHSCGRAKLATDQRPSAGTSGLMLDLIQVRSFVSIVETGGFQSAARQLGLAQPTVSQHLRKLEEALGVALVVRSNARCQTT